MSIEAVALAAYVLTLGLLFAFSLRQAVLAQTLRVVRSRAAVSRARPPSSQLPTVTIQLPIYNECYVARRVIDAVAAIDYPRERLSVQVLDDSTDLTTSIIASAVASHHAGGLDITHVRRANRDGFKAGALSEGLRLGTGELVAILDADFVPAPDVLTALVPPFEDPGVAAVQARWSYLNEAESTLTRIQAFMLDLHFRLEQPARYAAGLFLNFNGTAGVWRRSAIEDAGGWSARTVTEDIDLSYRAQLRGWRLVYLSDYVVPGELPGDMTGLRSQQERWIKGGAQNARLHLITILRSRMSRSIRGHAAQHLVSGSTYVVILAMLILSVPLAATKNTAITFDYQDLGLPFVLATAALGWTFYVARAPRQSRNFAQFVALLAGFMIFTMGLSVHNGIAAITGWFGRSGGEFVRTPKAGSTPWRHSAYAGRRIDRQVLFELGMIIWLTFGLAVAVVRREPALVPLQLVGLAGTAWVVALSLWHPLRARVAAGAPAAGRTAHDSSVSHPTEEFTL